MMNNTDKGKMINEDDGAPAPEQSFPGQGGELFPSPPGVPRAALFQSLQPLPQTQHVPNVGTFATEVPLSCVALHAPDPNDNIFDHDYKQNSTIIQVFANIFGKYPALMEKLANEKAEELLNAKRGELLSYAGFLEMKLRDDQKRLESLENQVKDFERTARSLGNKIKSVKEASGSLGEDDADEKAYYVDQVRPGNGKLDCKACGKKVAKVMMLPCSHICACVSCDVALEACPMCGKQKERSVELYLPPPPY